MDLDVWMDVDFFSCFGRELPSYNQINTEREILL